MYYCFFSCIMRKGPRGLQAARTLLTLHPTDPKRLFEGEALMRRMNKYGLLDESQNKLDYVLALTPSDFLERRLQTLVFKLGLAKSIHHARVLIRQRHIRCGRSPIHAVVSFPSSCLSMSCSAIPPALLHHVRPPFWIPSCLHLSFCPARPPSFLAHRPYLFLISIVTTFARLRPMGPG